MNDAPSSQYLLSLCVARSIIGPDKKLDTQIQQAQDEMIRQSVNHGGDFVLANLFWTNLVKMWCENTDDRSIE